MPSARDRAKSLELWRQRAQERLWPRVAGALAAARREAPETWETFRKRLARGFPALFPLLHRLYGEHHDFYHHLEQILLEMGRAALGRPADLRGLDARRGQDPSWFLSQEQLGAVCYVDRWAGDLAGIRERLPYLEELGVTYLHLMPLLRCPEGESDGGYAVSSYREVDPRLGTTEELRELAAELRARGISLCLDLVLNHTSDEHEWARRARQGDPEYQDLYFMFPDRELPDRYEQHLREIFPDVRRGSFTWCPEAERWVWTTFHSFQWDLDYSNPDVFRRMLGELLHLSNLGVEVLRLDAVAFLWKRLGTSCENLPEAHVLIRALRAAARIVAPAMTFKSEAIVHPDDVVRYVADEECPISYNPLLMALLWNSLATRKVRLLGHSLERRFQLEEGCSWVNYLRSHDDIGWTFDDGDAFALGVSPGDHRAFLNDFYLGRFPGSFARGLPFQLNPDTGDCRVSGTLASLAGLESAREQGNARELEDSLGRILLLHSVILTVGGIPLLYLGDEVGILNDGTYAQDPVRAHDSRWVHRPRIDWQELEAELADPESPARRIRDGLRHMVEVRKRTPVLAADRVTAMLPLANVHVLAFVRGEGEERLLLLHSFHEHPQVVNSRDLAERGWRGEAEDLLTARRVSLDGDLRLDPHARLWLRAVR